MSKQERALFLKFYMKELKDQEDAYRRNLSK